jgi:hypothetical protein
VTSNVSQNYPYSSESENERASRVERSLATNEGLRDKVRAESIGLPDESRWWVWKCRVKGCTGLLHTAGYARTAHAVYTVCDTCGQTALR